MQAPSSLWAAWPIRAELLTYEGIEVDVVSSGWGPGLIARLLADERQHALICEYKPNGQPRYARSALLELRDYVLQKAPHATPSSWRLTSHPRKPRGFIALYESYALYAEGAFGTIPELYVRPEHRTKGLGLHYVSQAKSFGASRGWTCLGVMTPLLPQFDRWRAGNVRSCAMGPCSQRAST